jgi:hypothetical protein
VASEELRLAGSGPKTPFTYVSGGSPTPRRRDAEPTEGGGLRDPRWTVSGMAGAERAGSRLRPFVSSEEFELVYAELVTNAAEHLRHLSDDHQVALGA